MIQELSINLDSKEKTCHRLEKKVRDLEGTLTINNEKRFKLQDTIGTMEKELQNTKAHMNQMSETSRYAPGMQQMYSNQSRRRNRYTCQRTPSKLLSQELLQASIENMDIIRRRLHSLTQVRAQSMVGREGENDEVTVSEYGDYLSESDLKEFIDHAHTLSQHDGSAIYSVNSMSTTKYDTPGCQKTTSMHVKNILIARDVVSHSLSKIREDIENSIMLVSKDGRQ